MSTRSIESPEILTTAARPRPRKKRPMNARRIVFSLAVLLLLGLFASPIAVDAQVEQDAPNAPADIDTDGDGLMDADEPTYGTDPTKYDTDGDGFGDNFEVVNGSDPLNPNGPDGPTPGLDSDGDLLSDEQEAEIGADPTKSDTDGDGLTDFAEVGFEPGSSTGTDPLTFDTDGDRLSDGFEVKEFGSDPTLADSDADGLGDGDELEVNQTDALNPDTDGDGFFDGAEIDAGTDPLDPRGFPGRIVESTILVEVRILPAGYEGNDYVGDSEPLAGVNLSFAEQGGDVRGEFPTDATGRVVFGGLTESRYVVGLGIPGDFADFITFYGVEDGVEPREHDGQNTNSTVVYVGPDETLFGAFYVIPVDARGDDPAPAPSPAPQPQQPTTPVKALPSTGAGVATASTNTGVTLASIVGVAAIVATMGVLGSARRRA